MRQRASLFLVFFFRRRLRQYRELLQRYLRSYWRAPSYNTTRLLLSVVAALIIGSFYWDLGSKRADSTDVANTLGAIYNASAFHAPCAA